MRLLFVVLPMLVAAPLFSCADQGEWKCPGLTSPDRQARACVINVGKNDESKVEIHDRKDRILASRDFSSPDGDHGRIVLKNGWTPDSRFFVFSTASSGGHSPWNSKTYFYDRRINAFKELDRIIGPVVREEFALSAPDWIEVTVVGRESDSGDDIDGHKVRRQLSKLGPERDQ
jgi:hypothetical protein